MSMSNELKPSASSVFAVVMSPMGTDFFAEQASQG